MKILKVKLYLVVIVLGYCGGLSASTLDDELKQHVNEAANRFVVAKGATADTLLRRVNMLIKLVQNPDADIPEIADVTAEFEALAPDLGINLGD